MSVLSAQRLIRSAPPSRDSSDPARDGLRVSDPDVGRDGRREPHPAASSDRPTAGGPRPSIEPGQSPGSDRVRRPHGIGFRARRRANAAPENKRPRETLFAANANWDGFAARAQCLPWVNICTRSVARGDSVPQSPAGSFARARARAPGTEARGGPASHNRKKICGRARGRGPRAIRDPPRARGSRPWP